MSAPVGGLLEIVRVDRGKFSKQEKIFKIAQFVPHRVEGYATVVGREGDAVSGTCGVHVELPNPALKLPVSLICSVRFVKSIA